MHTPQEASMKNESKTRPLELKKPASQGEGMSREELIVSTDEHGGAPPHLPEGHDGRHHHDGRE
jgi:hypothetical protein